MYIVGIHYSLVTTQIIFKVLKYFPEIYQLYLRVLRYTKLGTFVYNF